VLHSIKVRLYRRFIGRNKDRNKALFWQKRKVKSAKWKRKAKTQFMKPRLWGGLSSLSAL